MRKKTMMRMPPVCEKFLQIMKFTHFYETHHLCISTSNYINMYVHKYVLNSVAMLHQHFARKFTAAVHFIIFFHNNLNWVLPLVYRLYEWVCKDLLLLLWASFQKIRTFIQKRKCTVCKICY